MPTSNAEIADAFDELADLLEIENANFFRVRAYRNAASAIRGRAESMAELVARGEDLTELPDIGEDLAAKIETLVETGKLPLLEQVEARTPATLAELMKIKGLGAKRVRALYDELRIATLDDLESALEAGSIRKLRGFGPKTERMIGERLRAYTGQERRMPLADAEAVAGPLVAHLKRNKGVESIVVAGSYRRRKETVGDLDILVVAKQSAAVMDDFVGYEDVNEIVSKGTTRSAVRLRNGLAVDLRVVPRVSYGAALHYFTGSKSHNIAVRRLGVKKGYKINEYGVFDGERRIAGRTEKEVYASVGLPYIPPELRESRGELEAARRGPLPDLVTLESIRGDLHCHTDATDGRHSLRQMADAAAERGYDYISINDHSKRVTVAHGLDQRRLLAQIDEIDALNEQLEGFVILKSVELDILENGKLDLPDAVLAKLDFTVCAVHSAFDLPMQRQTERILRAMDNVHFNILAHPTGRLIAERAPYAVDMERILAAARDRGCIVELNANPARLDLSDVACKLAKDAGVKISIATDAHSVDHFAFMRFGIDQARRGWLEAEDVINTRPLRKLKKLLARS